MNGIYAHHNVVLITNEETQEALKAQKDIDMPSKYNVMEKCVATSIMVETNGIENDYLYELMVKDD